MIIRRNTKAFKTILEIVTACQDRPDREKLIRLFITKAGDTIRERISVEGIEGGAALFYEMNYQSVLGNLRSSSHQLYNSDEAPGIYYFHSSSNKVWDETPFEFDEAIKKAFASLPELPAVRKKEKAEKFTFPAPNLKRRSGSTSKEKGVHKKGKGAAPVKQETEQPKRPAKVVALWPKQPDYRLKQEIHFTGLERIVLRQAQMTKRDVLNYYDRISEYLLPYLKDRPQVIRLHRDGQPGPAIVNQEALKQLSTEDIPGWIRTASLRKDKSPQALLCNDREHLLFYLQIGCLEFHSGSSRIKSPDLPDYLILEIESPDYELVKAIDVALTVKEILEGLQLPSFIKTDGNSGLHVYIPLDSRSDFEAGTLASGYLCKLVRLKIPDQVILKGTDDHNYGKVTLGYPVNPQLPAAIAPYSLVDNNAASVATPLLWEEVKDGLKAEAFNHETIFKRLKQMEDPFKALFRKKVNADALVKRLEEHYGFLF